MDEEIKFVEITDLEDDLLPSWLDLYETTFPPNEKVLVSHFIHLLKAKKAGKPAEEMMLAAVNSAQELFGMAYYALMPEKETAVLWYLATWPEQRNRGLGGSIYEHLVSQIDPSRYQGLVIEVEIPELAENDEQRQLAERRIQFYRRHGGRWLKGIKYLQNVGWHQPLTPMYILIHPLQPLDALAALELAKAAAGGEVTQNGPLELV
jgi:hypothetical protein